LGYAARDAIDDLSEFRTILRSLPPDPRSIFDGVAVALSTFRQASYPMAVVTNKPADLSRSLLEGLGLADHFDVVIGGDTAPFCKPHPAPVEWALERLGCSKQRAVLIGDSDVDALAAKACAIPFILYEGGYGSSRCAPNDIAAQFRQFDHLPRKILRLSSEMRWSIA
jgi:phosphoglycolate phosphatase